MNDHSRSLMETAATLPATVRFANAQRIPLVWLGGLPIAAIDRVGSAEFMLNVAIARRGAGGPPPLITSANGQVLSMCARDGAVRALFEAADLIHVDGTPLVFASRLRSVRLPERVATTDLFHDVAERAPSVAATFYLLGATDEVIARAAENVRRRYPRLTLAGYRSGYFSAAEESEVVAQVNAARPDILWVGMGAPAEQRFCLRVRARLSNVGLIKTSGGLFDFVSGRNSRAPGWMQAIGLEWAYRMALEPRRLAYRYLTTNPHAAYLLLTSRNPR
jgi:N-acetylglucosaminyldiphosphoundecaprenol N-acetyl-beta-D-mannosaminyltransferase